VGADLLEDVLTGLTLLALDADAFVVWPTRVLLALASLAKWAGLLGVAALILSSFLRRHPAPSPRTGST